MSDMLPEQHAAATYPLKPAAFSSAASKVKWANQHILHLEKGFAAAREASVDAFFAKNDPETEGVVQLGFDYQHFLRHLPALRMLAGDAVHNLRSALDHLAFAIVGAFREPSSKLYFPIDIERNSLIGQRSFREIQAVAPDIADVIVNEIKPYGAGNPFVALNHLGRADKHRYLLVHTVAAEVRVYMAKDDDDPIPEQCRDSFVLIANPTRLPRVGSLAAAHNEQYRQATFDIKFDAGLPLENEPVIPTLHQLADLVAGTINILATHCFGQRPP